MANNIYALIDTQALKSLGIELTNYIKHLNSKNIKIAQYRNKTATFKVAKTDLELINSIYRGKLIINDYIELIELADGLHLGQEDLEAIDKNPQIAVSKVREKIGNKLLGLSTHNKEEIAIANTLDLNYIGLGAYRATNTKAEAKVVGTELLKVAKSSTHKVALIGGVTLQDNFNNYPQISYRVIGSDLMREYLKL